MRLRKTTALVLAITMVVSTGINVRGEKIKVKEKKKEYLVLARTNKKIKNLNNKYNSTKNQYTKYIEDENIGLNIMTESEAEELEESKDVVSVEENIKLEGNGRQQDLNPNQIVSDWNKDIINVHDKKQVNVATKNKVKVAIIDSGVDECDGIEVKERYNLVPSEKDCLPVYDDITGHGTAVASIIAGSKVKDRKSTGINSNVELYSIKIMDGDNTAPLSRVIEAIYKAIEYDVDIINMSFGTTKNSEILHQAVRDAYESGILMIAAAGNRGEGDKKVEYPAAHEEVMAVGQ